MIDFTVAFDKSAQFETADEMAEYLKDCGIKARTMVTGLCAISVWMTQQTGFHNITGLEYTTSHGVRGVHTINLTDAMKKFVRKFDQLGYPELLEGR